MVKNRFNGLQLADREPEELWSDIRDIVKKTAGNRVPKAKSKNVTKWLSDENRRRTERCAKQRR